MLCWCICIRSGVGSSCGGSRISICRSRCVDGEIGSRSVGLRIMMIVIINIIILNIIVGSSMSGVVIGNSIIKCSVGGG